MASFGRFTPSSGGVVETLSYTSPTLSLTQSAGTSPLTATIAGGGVDGSGTASFVSVWTDENTLGDSLIRDNGANVYTEYLGDQKGLNIDFVNSIYTIGDPAGLSYGNNITLNNSESRVYIETNRTHLKNLSTATINGLTAPLEGDIVYNSTLHVPCFYDGTGWFRLTHLPM
jgi:hypothetical protein